MWTEFKEIFKGNDKMHNLQYFEKQALKTPEVF